jgi:starch synthase
MRILFCAAEAAPLIKVGGLADVVGSLPSALQALGHDVRIILPYYGSLREKNLQPNLVAGPFSVTVLGKKHEVRVLQTALPPHQTPLYLLDWPGQFEGDAYTMKQDQKSIEDGVKRFIIWSWAIAKILPKLPWQPEFLHLHDWHAAAIPAFAQAQGISCPPSLLTIHNLSIQGRWNADRFAKWVPVDVATTPSLRLRDPSGDINMMQLGVYTATAISTVSPTYAQEILKPAFGEKLDPDLTRVGVVGIVNGIDTDIFNPETDRIIHQQYTVHTAPASKPLNTEALRQQVGLPISAGPLFGFIGRLTSQKGLDVLIEAVPHILERGGQVIVLGSGFPDLEQAMRQLEAQHKDAIRVIERFDAVLAQQMYAGLDALLMPSRFEPCGLGQLIAMRYGTIPIVADTGGLHDTVIDVRRHPESGTGYVVQRDSVVELCEAITHFCDHRNEQRWFWNLVRRSMEKDSSWYTSAHAYDRLYAETIKKYTPPSL